MDGGGAPQEGQGGGVAQALMDLDKTLFQVVSAVQKAPIPDDIKAKFSTALDAYRAGLEGLTGGAQEGPKGQPMPGAATPEQGANPNARPMNHGGM